MRMMCDVLRLGMTGMIELIPRMCRYPPRKASSCRRCRRREPIQVAQRGVT